jgi:hypothetical protein
MSFEFTPLSDEELDLMDLVPEGEYDFEVIKSQRKTSKKGNPMCELQLQVYDKEGRSHIIFDYLVFSSVNLNIKKISHFAKAVGLHEQYMKGSLPEEFHSFSGKCLIGIQDEMPKDSGGFYPKKNIVVDYIKRSETVRSSTQRAKIDVEDFKDDDIPF